MLPVRTCASVYERSPVTNDSLCKNTTPFYHRVRLRRSLPNYTYSAIQMHHPLHTASALTVQRPVPGMKWVSDRNKLEPYSCWANPLELIICSVQHVSWQSIAPSLVRIVHSLQNSRSKPEIADQFGHTKRWTSISMASLMQGAKTLRMATQN